MVYRISGNWLIGVACDLHTVESIYLGVDEYGHNRFENTRSVIGELVYQLKYQNDQTTIPKIIDLLLQNIKGIESFDAIIPVPSSKIRRIQPVDAISKALGDKCKVPVLINYLVKNGDIELKGITDPADRDRALFDSIVVAGTTDLSEKNVLLVDDLYRSGATLDACCRALKKSTQVKNICVLTMTKTRKNR